MLIKKKKTKYLLSAYKNVVNYFQNYYINAA
jgi:hypothetical protein